MITPADCNGRTRLMTQRFVLNDSGRHKLGNIAKVLNMVNSWQWKKVSVWRLGEHYYVDKFAPFNPRRCRSKVAFKRSLRRSAGITSMADCFHETYGKMYQLFTFVTTLTMSARVAKKKFMTGSIRLLDRL